MQENLDMDHQIKVKPQQTLSFEEIDAYNKHIHSRLREVAQLRAEAWRILAKMYPKGYTSQQVETVPQWQRSVALADQIFAEERRHNHVV